MARCERFPSVIEADSEYSEELNTASSTATTAGTAIDRLGKEGIKITRSNGRDSDFVTNAGPAADEVVREHPEEAFSRDGIVSEGTSKIKNSSGRIWIVDPTDGTSNSERGWRYFCVSIALPISKEHTVEVVHLPVSDLNQTFLICPDILAFRISGSPSERSPVRVEVFDRCMVRGAFVTCFWSHSSDSRRIFEHDVVEHLLDSPANYRETGSGVLRLCEIAEDGRDCQFDIVDEWDYAGGSLIPERAGGTVEQLPNDGVIASNGTVHNEIRRPVEDVLLSRPESSLIKS